MAKICLFLSVISLVSLASIMGVSTTPEQDRDVVANCLFGESKDTYIQTLSWLQRVNGLKSTISPVIDCLVESGNELVNSLLPKLAVALNATGIEDRDDVKRTMSYLQVVVDKITESHQKDFPPQGSIDLTPREIQEVSSVFMKVAKACTSLAMKGAQVATANGQGSLIGDLDFVINI